MRQLFFYFTCVVTTIVLSSHVSEQVNACAWSALPDVCINNYDTRLRKEEQTWLFNNKPFSGFMTEVENGRTVYKLPILNGKEHGLAFGWYNSGEKLLHRFFINGKKEGEFKQWWPNGNVRYLFHFKNDLYDGEQIVFFPDGSLREQANYILGKLAGRQRVWNEEHELISNYLIKKDKIYGLRAVKSCMPVAK